MSNRAWIQTAASCVAIMVILFIVSTYVHNPKKNQLQSLGSSTFRGLVLFEKAHHANQSRPDEEYVSLLFSRDIKNPIPLSGWYIQGSRGVPKLIPAASILPHQGGPNETGDIKVWGGERVIIISGHSPIGVSFRTNICSGFLDQFQKFNPPLGNTCPFFADVVAEEYDSVVSGACLETAKEIPRCDALIGGDDKPPIQTKGCREFLEETLSYNSCIAVLKEKPNFLGNEWRVYLDSDTELWRDRGDTIRLFDESGSIVTTLRY